MSICRFPPLDFFFFAETSVARKPYSTSGNMCIDFSTSSKALLHQSFQDGQERNPFRQSAWNGLNFGGKLARLSLDLSS